MTMTQMKPLALLARNMRFRMKTRTNRMHSQLNKSSLLRSVAALSKLARDVRRPIKYSLRTNML